jgi:propanol-preferring alcohol dehydrogenase
VPVRTEVSVHPLAGANGALEEIRSGRLRGAAVLDVALPGEPGSA